MGIPGRGNMFDETQNSGRIRSDVTEDQKKGTGPSLRTIDGGRVVRRDIFLRSGHMSITKDTSSLI
jgi:hypothetical protein